jgi:hypothetical protein
MLGTKMIPALRVATEKAALFVVRHSFRITKFHPSRLDWHLFSDNSGKDESLTDP